VAKGSDARTGWWLLVGTAIFVAGMMLGLAEQRWALVLAGGAIGAAFEMITRPTPRRKGADVE